MSAHTQHEEGQQTGLRALLHHPSVRCRAFIVVSAVFVCAYALGVIGYVMTLPEIGVRSAFSTVVNSFDPDFLVANQDDTLRKRDRITRIAGQDVEDWPQLLRVTARQLRDYAPATSSTDAESLRDLRLTQLNFRGDKIVRIDFDRNGDKGSVWVRVARPQLDTLAPTILWFFIKAGLFVVGALVFWKRPEEPQARMFFLFCVVSCAAYIGGYHWHSIVTQPALLIVFMATSILLPSVTLHFYLLFPRPKPFYERHPTATLLGLYAPALLFLALMAGDYLMLRAVAARGGSPSACRPLLERIMAEIYIYFGVALVLYLLSIWCLVYGFRTASNALERNQVKWILYGAVAALAPMMYSLYLAVLERDRFGGGGATWPMFFASVFVTLAFAVSITRYRLMELDRLFSSGAGYVSISILAALVYYGMVIVGVLALGSTIVAEPTLVQGLGVAVTASVLVGLLDLARGRLLKVLDKLFRREKRLLDHTLARMSEAVDQLVDSPTLAHRLLQTTSELVGAPRGAVYLREGEAAVYRLADHLGEAPPLTELSPGCPLIEELQKHDRLRVDPREDGPAVRQLQFLGGELALALAHEGKLLALLLLGRRDGEPYRDEDVNLLTAFTHVTVLALVSSESGRTIETLNGELQAKIEKIAEQQRRILALESRLLRKDERGKKPETRDEEPAAASNGVAPSANGVVPLPAGQIVGSSPALRQLMDLVRKVSPSDKTVLLRGESGTGKELLARAVHEFSPRVSRPFVRVHCAALSSSLLESELFGHVRGAFTGAVRDRPGRFELANGGTLFLDEIGDVSWEVQTKLLRVLQEKTFERVGSSEPIAVDVRIIAATHQNLERLIQQGRFREDLLYRINVLPIELPPLRDRREDIPELVQHFLDRHVHVNGKGPMQLDDDALALLKAAPWPGNIRQLEHVLERAVTIAEGPVLAVSDLPAELREAETVVVVPGEAETESPLGLEAERADRERREREQLVRALASTDGNKAEAARALGLARSTLVSRLKKYGLS